MLPSPYETSVIILPQPTCSRHRTVDASHPTILRLAAEQHCMIPSEKNRRCCLGYQIAV